MTGKLKNKKIGLALSGGAARGFAHLGVLKSFEENNIPVDLVAGTSAGSFVGAAFAAGMAVDDIIVLAKKMGWTDVVGLPNSPRALMTNNPIGKFIERNFPAHSFEDLKMPYAAIACEFSTGQPVILSESGSLAFAVMASCAVPGVFAPLIDEDGKMLVDGGLVNPFPTDITREMGADIVIGVDLMGCGSDYNNFPRTAMGMMMRSAIMLLASVTKSFYSNADVVIVPPIAHIRPDEIKRADELIDLGRRSADELIDSIKDIIY